MTQPTTKFIVFLQWINQSKPISVNTNINLTFILPDGRSLKGLVATQLNTDFVGVLTFIDDAGEMPDISYVGLRSGKLDVGDAIILKDAALKHLSTQITPYTPYQYIAPTTPTNTSHQATSHQSCYEHAQQQKNKEYNYYDLYDMGI